MIISGIQDIRQLYANVTDNAIIARALYADQNLQVARAVGVKLPRKRLAEKEIVALTRLHLDQGLPPRTCAGCVFQGRRWIKANEGEPLGYYLDRDSLRAAFRGADESWDDIMQTLTSRFPQCAAEEVNISTTVPDVVIRADEIDGRFGTLGYAATYQTEGSDDLDVGGDRWVSAELVMDMGELWDQAFHFTVGSHEWLHIWALDHSPAGLDDIQAAIYTRNRRDYGTWTHQQLTEKYVGVLPA